MICQWNEFIKLLPPWLQEPINKLGKDSLTELRLRVGLPPRLDLHSRSLNLDRLVKQDDIEYCINAASRYSPWATGSAANGYITTAGGHRIGICGEAIIINGACTGFRNITSLCMRVARDFPDLAKELCFLNGSVLIIGPPGCGKTTLLRDLIRQRSCRCTGSIAVLDERSEIFPSAHNAMCFDIGPNTDVMNNCPKASGIDMLIRNMGPRAIAVDEITAARDCSALLQASWCGIEILATAHAYDKRDLYRRLVYRPIIERNIFQQLIILHHDKTWHHERMEA